MYVNGQAGMEANSAPPVVATPHQETSTANRAEFTPARMAEIRARLLEPFNPAEIKWRVTVTATQQSKNGPVKLSVQVKGAGPADGIELFPKQDRVEAGQFGNAIRGPLGLHRAVNRRYWFYGAKYELAAQMKYLRELRRVTERQLAELIAGLPAATADEPGTPRSAVTFPRSGFQILDHLDTGGLRRVGRNWVTQCPSCAAAGRDRSRNNLAISVAEPLKYLCWAGCTSTQIRAALGAPVPVVAAVAR